MDAILFEIIREINELEECNIVATIEVTVKSAVYTKAVRLGY